MKNFQLESDFKSNTYLKDVTGAEKRKGIASFKYYLGKMEEKYTTSRVYQEILSRVKGNFQGFVENILSQNISIADVERSMKITKK